MLSIAGSRSLEQIFEQIVRGVAQTFNLTLARLWLIEPDTECPLCSTGPSSPANEPALHLRSSAGRSISGHEYTGITGSFHRIPLGQRKIGQIALSGRPMIIPHVTAEDPWAANPQWLRDERIESFAGQPLEFRGETLGVLAIFSRTTFSPDAFRWLRTFADHAAVAIANAKAFDELDLLKKKLEAENEYLHSEIRDSLHFGAIVGQSASLRKVLDQVELVAQTTATVLIQGESGTGKELIARAIHERSSRKDRPFIKVNCGAVPGELFESEFFGHVKGAFTGAINDRIGRFELAHTGDLFLDEIAEIPLALQAKLLRVLQEKQFERVGDARTRNVDVRIIGATNRDLRQAVEEGTFREDLFYRLTVFPIEVPPLRQRKEDIPVLAQHFLAKSAARLKIKIPRLSRENLRQLQQYDWPGNIRELENVIERAAILSQRTGQLSFDVASRAARPRSQVSLVNADQTAPDKKPVLTKTELRKHETENILAALQKSNDKVFGPGGAAELLGMRPTTLASRIKALGLKRTYIPREME